MVSLALGLGLICARLAVLTTAQLVVIDDQNGDEKTGLLPVYSPSANWQQGATCVSCGLKPNAFYAFDGTWHDSTYDSTQEISPEIPSFTLLFYGKYSYVDEVSYIVHYG